MIADRMIPFWKLTQIRLGDRAISVQLLLAAIGILVAHFLLLRRARSKGLNPETAAAMSLTMVLVGLVCAYWFRGVYLADAVKQDWRTLLTLQPGAASFGGIAGGLLGGWGYLKLRRLPRQEVRRYLDALAFVFPCGWVFGRLGCTLIHDHPGAPSTSLLAVQFPDGSRFDLAVIEVLFLIAVLIPLFAILDRTKHPNGFWLGAFLSMYGAFRVCLDFLHVDPPRYGPFTVDAWAYGTALLVGVILLISSRDTVMKSA
jgi:phosphatidylglycerol:prolipoprotein diacylglycerol transferase